MFQGCFWPLGVNMGEEGIATDISAVRSVNGKSTEKKPIIHMEQGALTHPFNVCVVHYAFTNFLKQKLVKEEFSLVLS